MRLIGLQGSGLRCGPQLRGLLGFCVEVKHELRKGWVGCHLLPQLEQLCFGFGGFEFEGGFAVLGGLGLRGWGVAYRAMRYPDC